MYSGYGANIARIEIGRTYGGRTVLEPGEPYMKPNGRHGCRRWKCRCVCGAVDNLGAETILRGTVCQACTNKAREKADAPLNRVKENYRRNARRRGVTWSLSDAEVDALFQSVCHYCGDGPSNVGHTATRSDRWAARGVLYSGLDRIDNSKGYEPDNVLPCCRTCNWAKGKKTYAEFMAWLHRVVEFRSRRLV